MVFDIWSTGKFSLPLGQDYKAETITFPMSSDVDIAAQYRDATIEDDGPGVAGHCGNHWYCCCGRCSAGLSGLFSGR